jgi:vanillate O-demethylase monooxygenase subunit
VQTFPVQERHDAIWICFGEHEFAERFPVADFGFIDSTPSSAKFHGLMPTNANYQLISDNLLDLSHISFVHRATFGDILLGARMTLETNGQTVNARWASENFEPTADSPYRAFVPTGKADIAVTASWTPPAQVIITNSAVPAGTTPGASDQILALHSLTPETAGTTHYFYCVTRRFRTHDLELTRIIKTSTEAAFTLEDKPMIEAQQQRMATFDLLAQNPLLLPIDAAAVRVRRMLQQMIEAETGSKPA